MTLTKLTKTTEISRMFTKFKISGINSLEKTNKMKRGNKTEHSA